MKSILIVSVALFVCASAAQAGVNSDLSRRIESKVDSAHNKAATAQAAFDAGDANSGCRALVGAARELDSGIDMSIRLVDETTDKRSIGENADNYNLVQTMRFRLQSIVDERRVVQQQLESRCHTAA